MVGQVVGWKGVLEVSWPCLSAACPGQASWPVSCEGVLPVLYPLSDLQSTTLPGQLLDAPTRHTSAMF